jgi:hypothetical protein
MERILSFKTFLWAMSLFISNILNAQNAPTGSAPLVLHVEGLTSGTRDAIVQDLTHDGEFRVSYACVPAGLIILEAVDPDRSTDSVRLRVLPRLLRNVEPTRIREDHLTLEMAEERCAEARN